MKIISDGIDHTHAITINWNGEGFDVLKIEGSHEHSARLESYIEPKIEFDLNLASLIDGLTLCLEFEKV